MTRVALSAKIQLTLDGIVDMINLVESATAKSTEALLTSDVALAEQVIAADADINRLYRELDAHAFETLALQAPVAADLRAVLAAIRMIGDVERSGDLALNIAKIVRHSAPLQLPVPARACITEMDARARELLRAAAFAVENREPDVAERADLMDDQIDQLRGDLYRGLLSGDWEADRSATVNLPLVARYYERIADHAVSVAERVEYLSTGTAHSAHTGS